MVNRAFGVEAEHLGARTQPRGSMRQTGMDLIQQRANSLTVERRHNCRPGTNDGSTPATLRTPETQRIGITVAARGAQRDSS